jgi:hypothetical protein
VAAREEVPEVRTPDVGEVRGAVERHIKAEEAEEEAYTALLGLFDMPIPRKGRGQKEASRRCRQAENGAVVD